MVKISRVLLLFLLTAPFILRAQTNDLKIGSDPSQFKQINGALYDFSEPDQMNIKVAVWGFVRFPGRYIVPITTTVTDLISFAGGPTDAANLEDLRLYRTLADSTYKIFKFNFNELLYEKEGKNIVMPPQLQPSDIVILPGEPRLYFKDYVSLVLAIASTTISLAILILNIAKK